MLGHPVLLAKYFVYTAFLHGLQEFTWPYKVWQSYKGLQGIVWLQWFTQGFKGLQGVKRSYKRLQRVTDGGNKRLQGVTRGYKGFQGVTRGSKGLQGVTRGYRGLQAVTGFPKEKMNTNCTWKIRHASPLKSRLEILTWRYGTLFAIILFCIEWWACRTICLLSYFSYNLLVIYL